MKTDIEMEQGNGHSHAARAAGLRPLKEDELVCKGDWVAAEPEGFEPWEGPSGFQAAAFLKKIYRSSTAVPMRVKKRAPRRPMAKVSRLHRSDGPWIKESDL